MKRFLFVFLVIIFINLYIILLFFFNIEFFTALLGFMKEQIGSIVGDSLYLVSVLGITAVVVVAFLLLRISSKS